MKNGKVRIRKAIILDVDPIHRVELQAWPPGGVADPAMISSRIRTFPDGAWVAVMDGEVIGFTCFEKTYSSEVNQISSWYQSTDNGYIQKSHKPDGDAIFGVDLSVIPNAPHGVGTKLLEQVGKEAVKNNIKYAFLGGRIPDYKHYFDRYSPEEYLKLRNEVGEPIDSEIRFYKNAGAEVMRVIPNYYNDSDSSNYGVLLRWKNPLYIENAVLGRLLGKILSFSLKHKWFST